MSKGKQWRRGDYEPAHDHNGEEWVGSFVIDGDDLDHAIECVNACAAIPNPAGVPGLVEAAKLETVHGCLVAGDGRIQRRCPCRACYWARWLRACGIEVG